MITIRESLEKIVAETPFLEEALGKGIINLSALARVVRPEIKKRLYKVDVSDAALVMALKRLKPVLRKKAISPAILRGMDDITVRTGLVEVTVRNSAETEQTRRELMKMASEDQASSFFNFVQGAKESTMLMTSHMEEKVRKILKNKVLFKLSGLSSITFALPPANRKTPGVYYSILKALAWGNINLVEIMSNYDEITLVFESKDIDQAFSIIKNLKG